MAGIGQIRHHDVEAFALRDQPLDFHERIALDYAHARIAEGVLVQRRQRPSKPIGCAFVFAPKQPQQFGVDVDQGHGCRVPAQQVAQGKAVAAAEHQYAVASVGGKHGRRRQIRVVDALVVGGELQPAVDVEADHVRLAGGDVAFGDDDVLVRRLQVVGDTVLEQRVAESGHPLGAEDCQHNEQPGEGAVAQPKPVRGSQMRSVDHQKADADQGVDRGRADGREHDGHFQANQYPDRRSDAGADVVRAVHRAEVVFEAPGLDVFRVRAR